MRYGGTEAGPTVPVGEISVADKLVSRSMGGARHSMGRVAGKMIFGKAGPEAIAYVIFLPRNRMAD